MEITPLEFSPEGRIEIGKALLKAQGNIAPLKKTESNPLYGSKYADLAAVIESIHAALQGAGIALLQGGAVNPDGKLAVETMLLHAESGQWARNVLTLVPVPDVVKKAGDGGQAMTAVTPQTIGKTITYGRRYGLQALLGIAAEDDDANAGSVPQVSQTSWTVHDYKLQGAPGEMTEKPGGLTEISGKLTNGREKKYPPDKQNPEGSTVHFWNLNAWTIWAKEKVLVDGLAASQGKRIEVIGKRSKKTDNMFEVVSWSPVEEEVP